MEEKMHEHHCCCHHGETTPEHTGHCCHEKQETAPAEHCCCHHGDTAPTEHVAHQEHCCCHDDSQGVPGHSCNCAGQEINQLGKTASAADEFGEIPPLRNTAQVSFTQFERGELTDSAKALWELHKEVIDATMAGGWDNETHPWQPELQDFWRYPLGFCTYGMLSMAMIAPEMKDEICEYVRKTVLLMKDTPIWDEWVRFGFNDNPITKDNIMYKGHLNLCYGVYQLLSGSREFEDEFQFLTEIILREYRANSTDPKTPYWGIQCEPDQYFPQCNSIGMMSLIIYDMIFGTDHNDVYGKKIYDFIYGHMSDPDTGLLFTKYHPSHDQAEAYITGFCNAWGLTMLHLYNPTLLKKAYTSFSRTHFKDMMGGAGAYIKEYADFDEASTGVEESMGVFYAMALTREYDDPFNWERFWRYFQAVYGMEIDENGVARLRKASKVDETFVHSYLLWGEIHIPWEKVLAYDWEAFRSGAACRKSAACSCGCGKEAE